jgi:NitT/TauT family transport system ATP-binding protein
VNDKTPHEARLKREYGMVFQAATLYDWRTVTQNVQLPLEIMGYSSHVRNQRAQEMLELVELGKFGKHYPWQLSGGMQQRVAIARALSYRPELLLMDEPFASVDAQTRFDLEDLILQVRRELGITVVLVTHDIDEAIYLSDRIVVLSTNPSVVREVVDVPLGVERSQVVTRSSETFLALRNHLLSLVMPSR